MVTPLAVLSGTRRWTRIEYDRLVEVARDTLEVHRDPAPSAAAAYGYFYRSVQTLRPSAVVAPLAAPGRPIPVDRRLP